MAPNTSFVFMVMIKDPETNKWYVQGKYKTQSDIVDAFPEENFTLNMIREITIKRRYKKIQERFRIQKCKIVYVPTYEPILN